MANRINKFYDWNILLGMFFLILGIAVLYLSFQSFEKLPNYLRIAAMIPFSLAFPFFRFKQYAKWNELSREDKWWLARITIPPILLIPGALIWLIFSPETYG
jgi:hypothetical protein